MVFFFVLIRVNLWFQSSQIRRNHELTRINTKKSKIRDPKSQIESSFPSCYPCKFLFAPFAPLR
jgi:hypothetical protein